jgi:hypothetical protein
MGRNFRRRIRGCQDTNGDVPYNRVDGRNISKVEALPGTTKRTLPALQRSVPLWRHGREFRRRIGGYNNTNGGCAM